MKHMRLVFFVLFNFFWCSRIAANYTVYLYVSSRNGSGSSAINYMTLTGNKGSSPETVINRFSNGSINTEFLRDGQLAIIENKFPADYGYLNKVKVGNNGDNLTIQSLNILDLSRNIWSNSTFVYPNGTVPASDSSVFLFLVNGDWSSWSNWGACSVTCGAGNMSRQRDCTNPPPSNGGAPCNDTGIQYQNCGNTTCPFWMSWSSWSSCSPPCGRGKQSRSRNCSDTSFGINSCLGLNMEMQVCDNVQDCPVNGQWSNWGDWTSCSVTCGSDGVINRFRTCTNPAPVNRGDSCLGLSIDFAPCGESLPDCPNINGNDFVSMDIFNSTINDLQMEIDELTNKVDRQNKKKEIILKQLHTITEWSNGIDLNLSDFKCLARQCRSKNWKMSDRTGGIFNYLSKLIGSQQDKEDPDY